MTQPRNALQRWISGGVVAVGALIASLGYDQELAYSGDGVAIPGLPQRTTEILQLYPWFYNSIWPSVEVFVVGAAAIVIGLIALRLYHHPQIGGHLIWAAVGVGGIGVAIHFSSIAVAGATETGITAFLIGILGLIIIFVAMCVFLVGLWFSINRWTANRIRHRSLA